MSQINKYPVPYEIKEFDTFKKFLKWQHEQGYEVLLVAQRITVPTKNGGYHHKIWSRKMGNGFLREIDHCHLAVIVMDINYEKE